MATKSTIADLKSDFNLLPDDLKADVMKTQIIEREKSIRFEAEQKSAERHNAMSTEGYHWVRAFFVLVLLVFVIASAVVIYKKIELDDARIRVEAGLPPVEQKPR